MDPLSIAASIAGLLSLTGAIITKGYTCISRVKNIEREVRGILDEVARFGGFLACLNARFSTTDGLESTPFHRLPESRRSMWLDSVKDCEKTLNELRKTIDSLLSANGVRLVLKGGSMVLDLENLVAKVERFKTLFVMYLQWESGLDSKQQLGEEFSCLRGELEEKAPYLVEVRRWLNARQCHEERNGIRRLEKSCEWALSRPELFAWDSQDDLQFFWVYGPTGCGKSYLYSKLLDYIEHDMSRSVIYYFFCQADNRRVTVSSLLRSWTFQIIQSIRTAKNSPEALNHLESRLSSRTSLEATPDEVSGLFLELLNISDTPPCVLTADALDECSDSQEFFHLLPNIPQRFKVLVTSRDLLDFRGRLRPLGSRLKTLTITKEITQGDIDRYLEQELKRLTIQGDMEIPLHVKDQIRKKLGDSEGMFLWVRLMLEHIRDQITVDGVIQCLDELPRSLSERYDRIIADVNILPDAQRLLAHRIFFWVLVARRPLSMGELSAALAVQPSEDRTMAFNENRQIKGDLESIIVNACRSLIRPRAPYGHLFATHSSVTRYLQRYMAGSARRAEISFSYGIQQNMSADSLAAAVCMRYLSSTFVAGLRGRATGDSKAVSETLMSQEPHFAFLKYAATHWFQHAQHIEGSEQLLLDIAMQLLDNAYPNVDVIWRLYWFADIDDERPGNYPTRLSGLHIAAYFGLLQIVRHYLHSQVQFRPDPSGGSPLWWAKFRGHTSIVKLLTEAGFDMKHSLADRSYGNTRFSAPRAPYDPVFKRRRRRHDGSHWPYSTAFTATEGEYVHSDRRLHGAGARAANHRWSSNSQSRRPKWRDLEPRPRLRGPQVAYPACGRAGGTDRGYGASVTTRMVA